MLGNTTNALVAMLAAASIGALWSCTSPDFGTHSIIDRLKQIEPKILFSDKDVLYNSKRHDNLAKTKIVMEALPSLEKVVIFGDEAIDGTSLYEDFVRPHANDTENAFEHLPFDHPLFILYSSGTTGLPKCIVHSSGGVLLQHKKEHMLHCDITPQDVFFQFTTCAWMMWPWLVGALACGAPILLYDGSPFKPDAMALWRICDDEGVSVFGTSAKYIATLEQMQVNPAQSLELSRVRMVCSTGSVLPQSSFEYLMKCFPKLWIGSITGGTDICSLFCAPAPTLPVYSGEIQCKGVSFSLIKQ